MSQIAITVYSVYATMVGEHSVLSDVRLGEAFFQDVGGDVDVLRRFFEACLLQGSTAATMPTFVTGFS